LPTQIKQLSLRIFVPFISDLRELKVKGGLESSEDEIPPSFIGWQQTF
jgi:hypothetical protein